VQYKELIKSASQSDIAEIEKLQASIPPDSGCNIQFSSGTTGQPKAAILSHFSLVNNSYDIGLFGHSILSFFNQFNNRNFSGIRHELNKNVGRVCVNNPFFHVYGVVISIMNALHHGASLILPAPHFTPEESLKAIAREKCNVIYGTPTSETKFLNSSKQFLKEPFFVAVFVDLVSKQKDIKVDLPQIEFANTGGAICTPKLVKDVETFLNVKKIRSIYGLTETTSAVFQSLPSDENSKVQEFVGHVSDHLEVKVIDNDGNAVPFGQPGELCVRGYNIMLGYWNDEVKTKEILGADKWYAITYSQERSRN
jgi:medium-chain acyl-CoA ligase, mitochondrial